MYIDAFYDKDQDRILIAERVNGERILRRELPEYVFYFTHPQGQNRSIFGDTVKKHSSHDVKKFRNELAKTRAKPGVRIFESDINPVFRYLANHYKDAQTPTLHVGFFDIEVDFDSTRGFAPTDDPFSPITAISLYNSAQSVLYTLALCPPTLTLEEGLAIGDKFPDTFVFDNEVALLTVFLGLIEDIDVLLGWNSEGFDVPYLVNRIKIILGEDAIRKLCLWDQLPKEREYVKFMKRFKTYELVGRVHLDYLLLYQKHNTQQQHSYRLDFIGEIEVGETKTPYEGTLDDLYKKDFERFIEYNRQDVMLLVKIDKKRKFVDLANQIAHENCILLKTTMGTVSFVEQAIINEMHKMGFVVPDRKPKEGKESSDDEDDDEHIPVVGAYVATPKKGLHAEIGCVDINSLYPSAIRALNMSPETIVGQLRPTETMALVAERIEGGKPRAEAWEGIFETLEVKHMQDRDEAVITIDYEDGTVRTMTGAQLHDYVFDPNNHLCITANGTLFRTDKDGMIPKLLGDWYAERKSLQKSAKKYEEAAKEATDEAERKECLRLAAFYDQRQYAGKIRLNALYGALLQVSCRFFDDRLGQSTTLTGRSIVRHMNAKINQIITGDYDYRGAAIKYADTDSCYFSVDVWKDNPEFSDFDWTRESIIQLYDGIAEDTNATFPEFMARSFNVSPARGALIKAGRELVASKGLFIKKKKYAVLMYDKEGMRLDVDKNGKASPGKLKAMGLDLKRADTPKFMQIFLQNLLMDILQGADQSKMYDDIRAFREAFAERPGWEKGSPKKVSKLSKFGNMLKKVDSVDLSTEGGKFRVNMPGHVRASLNWNSLCDLNQDRYAMRLTDGARIIVCKLKPNPMKIDSVAYPIDEPHLPSWFKELPFDDAAMEETIIDKKITNLVEVLRWDLSETKDVPGGEFFSFGSDSKPVIDYDDDDEEDDDD